MKKRMRFWSLFATASLMLYALLGNRELQEISKIDLLSFISTTLMIAWTLFDYCYTVIKAFVGKRYSGPASDSKILSEVDSVLTFVELFLPSRITKEDAGDARELINRLHKEGAPSWMIYAKLGSSVFWILFVALREVLTVTKKKPN